MKLLIMFFALVVAYMGVQELTLFLKAPDAPVEVALKDIEAKGEAPENWLTLSADLAVYDSIVYSYMGKEGDPEASIMYAYYPLLPIDHPYFLNIIKMSDKYEEGDEIAPEDIPVLENFTVLVKTEKWKKYKDMPQGIRSDLTIKGMIVNDLDPIKSDEVDLLKQSFPKLDLDKVLILEEGRTPGTITTPLLMIGGGLLVFLIPFVRFFRKNRAQIPTDIGSP